MRLNVVINTVGIMLRYIALVMFLPIIFALCYGEYESILPFLTGALVSLVLGFLFSLNKASEKDIDTINKAEALATAFFAWVFFALTAAVPYLFYNLGIINSLFEAVSGVSTTGATILQDFSLYPKTFFFYRSMTQWLGGMGIIVLFVAILPKFSVAGRQMFFAENPNPSEEKITPRVRHTASWLWGIYLRFYRR
jgi:trk system potassium uptake protein TrkH